MSMLTFLKMHLTVSVILLCTVMCRGEDNSTTTTSVTSTTGTTAPVAPASVTPTTVTQTTVTPTTITPTTVTPTTVTPTTVTPTTVTSATVTPTSRRVWIPCAYIINHSVSEHMYAADDDLTVDKERRNVFSWAYRRPINQGMWRIEIENGTYLIYNLAHEEYLYLSKKKSNFYDGKSRLPFTWRRHDGTKPEALRWSLIDDVSGKYQIMNVRYNLFLYAAHYYDAERRHVLAHNKQWVELYGSMLWRIVPCW